MGKLDHGNLQTSYINMYISDADTWPQYCFWPRYECISNDDGYDIDDNKNNNYDDDDYSDDDDDSNDDDYVDGDGDDVITL